MSTATPSRPPAAYPASRPAPASSGGAGGAAIDPVRLLKQHKLSLLAAAIVGLLGGLGAYYVLLRLAPQYRASVTYQALPRGDDKPFAQESTGIEIQEMDRYTQTQARVMSGDRVIRAALNDPKVRNDTSWGVPFRTETGQINIADAAREFKDMVSARVVAGTSLIEMSITAGTSIDAATLANVVHPRKNSPASTPAAASCSRTAPSTQWTTTAASRPNCSPRSVRRSSILRRPWIDFRPT